MTQTTILGIIGGYFLIKIALLAIARTHQRKVRVLCARARQLDLAPWERRGIDRIEAQAFQWAGAVIYCFSAMVWLSLPADEINRRLNADRNDAALTEGQLKAILAPQITAAFALNPIFGTLAIILHWAIDLKLALFGWRRRSLAKGEFGMLSSI
jgi:hypothetical protein